MKSEMRRGVTILGAGGRAGRALGSVLIARGHQVTGLVRRPQKHRDLERSGVRLVGGDATSADDVGGAIAGAGAVVNAVTPFSEPPPDFVGFDEAFYARVVEAISGTAFPHDIRLFGIGLFATLPLAEGGLVMDDPTRFPPFLLPFARAHLRQLEVLEGGPPDVDWMVVTPPADLVSDEAEPGGGYHAVDPPITPAQAASRLSYAELAGAIADEIERPPGRPRQVVVLRTDDPR